MMMKVFFQIQNNDWRETETMEANPLVTQIIQPLEPSAVLGWTRSITQQQQQFSSNSNEKKMSVYRRMPCGCWRKYIYYNTGA
jgi:hypothetical protein